jgi:hypothetical protein
MMAMQAEDPEHKVARPALLTTAAPPFLACETCRWGREGWLELHMETKHCSLVSYLLISPSVSTVSSYGHTGIQLHTYGVVSPNRVKHRAGGRCSRKRQPMLCVIQSYCYTLFGGALKSEFALSRVARNCRVQRLTVVWRSLSNE